MLRPTASSTQASFIIVRLLLADLGSLANAARGPRQTFICAFFSSPETKLKSVQQRYVANKAKKMAFSMALEYRESRGYELMTVQPNIWRFHLEVPTSNL
jgi:hypothetical protein